MHISSRGKYGAAAGFVPCRDDRAGDDVQNAGGIAKRETKQKVQQLPAVSQDLLGFCEYRMTSSTALEFAKNGFLPKERFRLEME